MKNNNVLKTVLRRTYQFVIDLLNRTLPKRNRVLVIGNHNVEDNAVGIADYIARNYDIPVYYELSRQYFPYVSHLLSPKVKFLDSSSTYKCLFKALTSRYIFYTYPYALANYSNSKRQEIVNIWHGVPYKKLAKDLNLPGIPADTTIATSSLVQKILSKSFGVPLSSVIITGYPRNDMMLKAQENKSLYKQKLGPVFKDYKKVIIWMPTYRRIAIGKGIKMPSGANVNIDHVLQVENFKAHEFDALLRKHQTLCLVKPHQLYKFENTSKELTNIEIIDNNWIHSKNISLYQFLACTDALITDYSSVMSDYSLLEQPIFCFSTDLDNYKKTQGLYFDDFENSVPSQHYNNQSDFFKALDQFLTTGIDPNQSQRRKIRDLHFQYLDSNSSKRITENVLDPEMKKNENL